MRFNFTVLVAMLLCGCAITPRVIPSRLYNTSDGTVLSAAFTWKGETFGPLTVTKSDEACNGEYRTIVTGQTTVGTGLAGNGWGGLFSSMYAVNTVDRAQKGFAIAACPSGQLFECEYITNVKLSGVDGHGVCKDNRGKAYRLMF